LERKSTGQHFKLPTANITFARTLNTATKNSLSRCIRNIGLTAPVFQNNLGKPERYEKPTSLGPCYFVRFWTGCVVMARHRPPIPRHVRNSQSSEQGYCTRMGKLVPDTLQHVNNKRENCCNICHRNKNLSIIITTPSTTVGTRWWCFGMTICKQSAPCSRQTTTLYLITQFYRPDALPDAQPTVSKH